MASIQAIDENSPYLEAVKQLWRAHSDTLGFFPDGAFADYARQRHILVALNGTEFVGYVLYRIVREKAAIAHFCVVPGVRKQGIARLLLDHLGGLTKNLRGIMLTCNREFEANKSWPRLGFHFNGEIAGRAKKGSVLFRWWLDHGHPDMFSVSIERGTMHAAMDCNIFLDFVEHRNEETEALRADWLIPFLTLCYTPELLNDISHSADRDTRKKRSAEVQQFQMLRCPPEAQQKAEQLLKPLFPKFNTIQDESDFRHLARALATGADVFVTRDDGLLSRAEAVSTLCGLLILRPAELVNRIDSIENERAYERRFVAGTRQVSLSLVDCANDVLLDSVLRHGEKKHKLKAAINRCLADPRRFTCHKMASADGALLALSVVESDGGIDRVPILRVCAKRQDRTIARAVLTGLVRRAADQGSKAVLITEAALSDVIRTACSDLGFLSVSDGLLKLILRGWLPIDEVSSAISWTDPTIDGLKAALPAAKSDAATASQLEHLIRPAKLADALIPCFIVPIRPQFAEHLFDERLARGSLFGADVDLALNPESVYYRAAKPSGLKCPARVLWYVSQHESYPGTMSIRACSRIVELVRGTPKQLFPRFWRLGVYEWRHVLETADGDIDKEILAFRFDDSELLRPIPWDTFQGILSANGIVNHNIQSPVSITAKTFGEIYAAAFDPPKPC